MSGSLSVALYDLRTDAKNELERLVRGKSNGSLKDQELRRRLYVLDSLTLEPSCTLIMRDFQEHKWRQDEWVSEPFYTNPQGYKMNVSVYANGNGEGYGTHVSVFVQLMWGEYDNTLKWPFRGRVTVELLDQSGRNYNNIVREVNFSRAPLANAGRVEHGEMNRGWGEYKFISQNDLGTRYNPTYLKDDCLKFRVLHDGLI